MKEGVKDLIDTRSTTDFVRDVPQGFIAILVVNVRGNGGYDSERPPEFLMYTADNQQGQLIFNQLTDRDRDVFFVPEEAWKSKAGNSYSVYVGLAGREQLESQWLSNEQSE